MNLLLLLVACADPDGREADDTARAEGPGTLVEHGVVTCADPSLRDTLGPMYAADLGPDWPLHRPVGWTGEYYYGEGLAVADLTGDGRLDVLVADHSAIVFYASTPDGSWREESAARLPNLVDEGEAFAGVSTLAAVDVDGDGDLDLHVGRYPFAHVLLLNAGDGTFVDATAGAGLPTAALRVRATPWGDMDGDGDLDLFVGNDRHGEQPPEPGHPNALYENLGGGVFADVTDRLTDEDIYGYTRVAGWYDVDGDIDQDLYIVNHMPVFQTTRMLFNTGAGAFATDPDAGADIFISGMGLGVADLNEDRLPDMLVAGWNQLAVLESTGVGVWADTSVARRLVADEASARVVAWGSDFADFDADGRVDAVVVFGQAEEGDGGGTVEANPPDEPDGLWLQEADGTFTQVADAWGVADVGNGRAVAAVDLDDDGWLDLLVQGKNEAPVLHRARCGANAWLRVALVGRAPNTSAVGARVTVQAGGREHTRWVSVMGSSLHTSMPLEVHVGLGDVDAVERLEIRWPDGEVSAWEGVAARQIVTVVEEGASGP